MNKKNKSYLKIPQPLRRVIKKMCDCARVPISSIDFDSSTWYSDTTWTQKQSDKFKDWFVNELRTNNALCRELFENTRRSMSKERAENSYMWFNLMYGFKIRG